MTRQTSVVSSMSTIYALRHGSILMSVLKLTVCRSEEHTSELQSRENLVCRLLLEKKKTQTARRDEQRAQAHGRRQRVRREQQRAPERPRQSAELTIQSPRLACSDQLLSVRQHQYT